VSDQHEIDMELRLGAVTPLASPNGLRVVVLGNVERELAQRQPVRWDRRLAIAACLLLAFGVAANVAVDRAHDRRLAVLFGPGEIPQTVTDYTSFVNRVTDAETAEAIGRYLLAIRPPEVLRSRKLEGERRHVEAILNTLTLLGKGEWDAKTLEGHEADRDRRGDGFRGALDRPRCAELAREQTA
jgi:hypothetical protein